MNENKGYILSLPSSLLNGTSVLIEEPPVIHRLSVRKADESRIAFKGEIASPPIGGLPLTVIPRGSRERTPEESRIRYFLKHKIVKPKTLKNEN